MTWPLPAPDLEWRLRYGARFSDAEKMTLASILSAYRELIDATAKKRNYVIGKIREAR